jgi:hypothetical protein
MAHLQAEIGCLSLAGNLVELSAVSENESFRFAGSLSLKKTDEIAVITLTATTLRSSKGISQISFFKLEAVFSSGNTCNQFDTLR